MKLYHAWLSSASRRVRLCLAEKGLDFESQEIDLRLLQQHSAAYLAINPNGVVPTLELDDGRTIHESSTICEYLDEAFPDPPVRPADAFGRARMRNFVRHVDDQIILNLMVLNWSVSLAPIAGQWSDAQLQENLSRIPTQERRQAWHRIAREPYSDDERRVAL